MSLDTLLDLLRCIDTMTEAELRQVKVRVAIREQQLKGEVTLL